MNALDQIFGVLKDSEKYIYHYTKPNIAVDHLIGEGTFQLNPLTSTNDPKEVKDWQLSLELDRNDWEYPELGELSLAMTAGLKKRTFLGCFCADGSLTGESLDDIPARGWARARMWAQYGVSIDQRNGKLLSHQGVCLVYQKDRFHQAVLRASGQSGRVLHGRVRYLDRPFGNELRGSYCVSNARLRQLGLEEGLFSHAIDNASALFFEKGTDWATEFEYRWVLIRPEDDGPILVDTSEALRAVILGADCDSEIVAKIVDACAAKRVAITTLNWVNGVPWRDCEFEVKLEMDAVRARGNKDPEP